PTNLTLLSPTPKLYAYAQSHQASQPRISSAVPLAPAGAGGGGEGAWDPFPPRGNGRIRAEMEPSRKGHADACRVVPRPLAPTPPAPAGATSPHFSDEMVDLAGLMSSAVAIVDVDHRYAPRARIEHREQRREPPERRST